MLAANHVFSPKELVIIVSALSTSILTSALGWLLYIGIEPYVRRRWPHTLVSWNRLLLGQFRDSLVGRDVLIGITAATVLIALSQAAAVMAHAHAPARTPFLAGFRQGIGGVFGVLTSSFISSVGIYVLMFVLRVITRRDWIAAAVFVILDSLPVIFLVPDNRLLVATVSLIANSVAMILLFRFGIVVLLAWNFAALMLSAAPMTLHFAAWYAGNTLFCMGVLVAVALYAFRISLAGRPLFSEALLET